MFSGVGKSGSPGPKSTTSCPSAFSRVAAANTAAVELREMRDTLADSFIGLQLFRKLLPHQRRNQPFDRTSKFEYFPNQARAEVTISFSRHHEDRLNPGLQATIHQGHLQLIFIIGDRPDAAHDNLSFLADRIFH